MPIYTPDPTNALQPLDTDDASVGAAELRALKDRVNNLVGVGSTSFSRRNILHNGTGNILQDRAGLTNVIPTNGDIVIADRWKAYQSSAGIALAFSSARANLIGISKVSDSYLYIANGTGLKTVLDNADFALIGQRVEQVNMQHLRWGHADAKPITISFRAQLSVLANAVICVAVRNMSFDRCYVQPVNVTSGIVDYIITIPGDTSGTWTDPVALNQTGLELTFAVVAGSSYKTSVANAWQTGGYIAHDSISNFASVANAGLRLTDIQLEVGSSATPFDVRDFTEEVILCQRYYEVIGGGAGVFNGSGGAFISHSFKTLKRITPSGFFALIFGAITDGINNYSVASVGLVAVNPFSADMSVTCDGSPVAGRGALLGPETLVAYSAEL